MAYRKFYRSTRSAPTPRTITVKFDGKCACCGAAIKAGEIATYYPPGAMAGNTTGEIAHVGGLDGTGVRCTEELRAKHHPEYHAEVVAQRRARRAVNDYAGDGLDERYEDQCRDACGL